MQLTRPGQVLGLRPDLNQKCTPKCTPEVNYLSVQKKSNLSNYKVLLPLAAYKNAETQVIRRTSPPSATDKNNFHQNGCNSFSKQDLKYFIVSI